MKLFSTFKTLPKTLLSIGLLLGLSVSAQASLIGDTVTVSSTANFPVDTWTDSVLVGAGAELAGGDSSDHANAGPTSIFAALYDGDFIDIGADSIEFNFAALGAAGFFYAFETTFSDLDWGLEILSDVTLGTNNGLIGWSISDITDDSFTFQGTVDLINGSNFVLDLVTEVAPVNVPESNSLALLALGLAGMMRLSVRRRLTTNSVS